MFAKTLQAFSGGALTQKYLKEDNKNIETEPLKGPKFRKPRTETQKRWNFALCSLRRLLSDLRPKLARAACSNKGLRSDAMLAHEENSNASAYSVGPPRNFCFTDYSTIMNNAARTILTKVCKNRLFQISFWLCFVFW